MARIVFCEDELLLQKLIDRFLRSTEHEVHIASNGVEGLALIEQKLPDLILTDIRMPECDGFQLAAAVRANPSLTTIPIIFITAFAQKYDIEEAKQYNPLDYLIKPFVAEELRKTITEALRGERRGSSGPTR